MNSQRKLSKKRQLLEMHGDHCWICHRKMGGLSWMTIDHIVPQSEGGSHDLGNLRLAHRGCNNRRGNGPPPLLKLRPDMMVPIYAIAMEAQEKAA